MKLFFKELIILILLGFSSHIIAADSMTETEHKGKALVENIQGKLDSFEKKNLSLLSESKSNVELASKIIDWSAMVFAALAVLLIVAGAVGLREFSNFKNIKEEMTNEIRKVKKEISKIEGVRTEIQDELGSLKRKIKKESNDIFKTIYLLNEAITSFNTGNLQNTINTLTEILRINPNDYEATCLLARSYSGQEEYEKAIKTTEIATELSSNPHRALYIMAESYRRMGDFDEAINVHRRSLELELRSPPQNSLAYCYYKKRDFKEAEKEFKNSLKISRNPTAVIGLAKSLLMQGLHEEACEYCYEAGQTHEHKLNNQSQNMA